MVAGRQRSPLLRMLFCQGSWQNMLIFPWMIIPKHCAKRSNLEEAVERYSLSWLFEGCIPKKVKKMLEEQSIQYLCSISGNLFWSIILCCNGRFVDYKCNNTTNTLIWAQYLLLSTIKNICLNGLFCPLWRTFSAHLFIHCSIYKADHYFLSIPHNLYSACLPCVSTY